MTKNATRAAKAVGMPIGWPVGVSRRGATRRCAAGRKTVARESVTPSVSRRPLDLPEVAPDAAAARGYREVVGRARPRVARGRRAGTTDVAGGRQPCP